MGKLAIRVKDTADRARLRLVQMSRLRLWHVKYLIQNFREGPDSGTWRVALPIVSLYAPFVSLDDHVTGSFASDKTHRACTSIPFTVVVVVLQLYQSLLRPDSLSSVPWSRKGPNASPPLDGVQITVDEDFTYASHVPDRLIGTSLKSGLSTSEVEQRRCTYGWNEPFTPPKVAWHVIDSQIAAWPAMVRYCPQWDLALIEYTGGCRARLFQWTFLVPDLYAYNRLNSWHSERYILI